MLTLILFLLLGLFVLTAFLAAWTLWFQAYVYSEAVGQIYWRAPAAGAAIALFVALWVWLDYRSPGRFGALFDFTARQDQDPYKELLVETNDGREVAYPRQKRGGHYVYLHEGKEVPSRPKKITAVTETKEKLVFEPERDKNGNFKAPAGESLRYINKETGRVMVEGQWGQTETFRWWWFFQNLFLNFLHFALWCVCLWLLLHFQFWHAFGQAVVIWLAMTLFVLPPMFSRVEETAKKNETTYTQKREEERYQAALARTNEERPFAMRRGLA